MTLIFDRKLKKNEQLFVKFLDDFQQRQYLNNHCIVGISHSWAPTRLRVQFSIVFVVVFIWRVSGTELSSDNFPQFHVLGPAEK